jgi:hypothetical protein
VSITKTAVASKEARAPVLDPVLAVKAGTVQPAWHTQRIMTLTRGPTIFYFQWIVVPKSLFTVIALLIAGFIVSLTISMIRLKGKESNYQKVGAVGMNDTPSQTGAVPGTSYQNSDSTQYALPTTQKVVTYCVIDGRLVDS